MKDLGYRLKHAREQTRITQVQAAKLLGISNGTLSGYERNYRDPDTEMLSKLAKLYDVTVDYLLGQSNDQVPKFKLEGLYPIGERIKLPVIGIVKAGPNGLAYQDHLGEEWVDKDSINGGEYFWLQVKGDSMINDGIIPGDLALVRLQPEVENGDLAIVILDSEEGTLKRVYLQNNSIILQSSNPSYPPLIYTDEERSKVRIVGRVKEIKRKF